MKESLNSIVLVPTDFTPTTYNAIDHGIELAQTFNFKVCILHVINKDTRAAFKGEADVNLAVEKKLQEVIDEKRPSPDFKMEYMIREGSIFEEIKKGAVDAGAELIVLGTHGKKGIQHLFGSYALKVITSAPVPTIVVQKRPFGKGYKNIVLPINSYTESRQKVNWAVHLAKLFDAHFHLFQQKMSDAGLESKITIMTGHIKQAFEENNIKYTVTKAKKASNSPDQLLDYAVSNNCDMVMILTEPGLHNYDFNLDPLSEKIMFNDSQIPVMCINPEELGKVYYSIAT